LADTLPGIQYRKTPEGHIVIRGTADPTFLHPKFEAWQAPFAFLQQNKQQKLLRAGRIQKDHAFGDGWNWDDLSEDYAPERAVFPVYGNVQKKIVGKDTVFLPIQQMEKVWPRLLQDTLGVLQKVDSISFTDNEKWNKISSAPLDTMLRLMFQESDNMLAEQCLWMIGGQKFDTIGCSNVIKYIQTNIFKDAPFPFKWVDGSGLSRYNLFTPRSTVWLLNKMWTEYPHERILSLFPAGGVSGTIKNLYKSANNQPYVFAKTGTLSGVHTLSGFIRTQKGKWLIFSFMHNNYLGGSTPWKTEMQRFLEKIAAF
jgi:D-alanyl-D-alanine carboxypeptidase/D-alanyl-D-alanine-endopeptidase (penicillin-binding protein 4)